MKPAVEIQPGNSPAYPVYVEHGLDGWQKGHLLSERGHSSYFLITEKGLPRALVQRFCQSMSRHFPRGSRDPRIIWLAGGERSKNFAKLEAVYGQLVSGGVDRQSCLIALGGGVVGDLGGFVAASLLRGVDFIQIPTTLLAAVDSSVGGKVGVNLRYGKNMVGAFYHPLLVYCNMDFLGSLPTREWNCGLAEMLKHGLIEKSGIVLQDLFRWRSLLRNPEAPELRTALIRSIQVKADVVREDEREGGRRAVLNLGHTTAHALESLSRYRRFSHGEAVARGLVTALILSRNLRGLGSAFVEEFLQKMQAFTLPRDTAGFSARQVYEHTRYDKKNLQGEPHFVLLEAPGQAAWGLKVSPKDFYSAWEEQKQRFG